jgi:hypothetical protein
MVQQKSTVTFGWLTRQQCGVNLRGRIILAPGQHPQAIRNCNEVSGPQRRGSKAAPTRAATQAGRHVETPRGTTLSTGCSCGAVVQFTPPSVCVHFRAAEAAGARPARSGILNYVLVHGHVNILSFSRILACRRGLTRERSCCTASECARYAHADHEHW